MAQPVRNERIEDFKARWREWTRIVRLCALRRKERFDIESYDYGEFHAELLLLCRAIASESKGPGSQQFRECEAILTPWVSISSLTLADRDIIHQLLRRCTRAERKLGGRRRLHLDWPTVKPLAGIAIVAAILFVPLVLIYGGKPFSLPAAIMPSSWAHFLINVTGYYRVECQLLVIGTVVLALTMAVVWRSARSD